MGIFIVVCGLFCILIGVDKYYSAVKTAEAFAARVASFELESVGIPTETFVCGFFGVMLLVGGSICIHHSFQPDEMLEKN
jgi:hypothetical protein